MNPIPHSLPALAIGTLLAGSLNAQPRVDINLHRNNTGAFEVQLIPDADFNGIPSSLVFTVHWERTPSDAILELHQTDEQRACIPLASSGPIREVGENRYRVYSGIGVSPLSDGGKTWQGGLSLTIATFSPGVPPDLMIADDNWVHERRNNAAFYISLNGLESTGLVRSTPSASSEGMPFSFSLAPNPSKGQPVTFFAKDIDNASLTIEVTDATGKIIHAQGDRGVNGQAQGLLTTAETLAPGVYGVTARDGSATVTERLVVESGNK